MALRVWSDLCQCMVEMMKAAMGFMKGRQDTKVPSWFAIGASVDV